MTEHLRPEDPLARAEEALQKVPIPEGPSEETVARILKAMEAQDRASRPRFFQKGRGWAVRIAAAAVLVGALGAAVALLSHQRAVAYSEVAGKLRNARRLAFRQTVESPRLRGPQTFRFWFQEGGLIRSEGPDGQVAIHDTRGGKALILEPASRSGLLIEVRQKPEANPGPAAYDGLQWLAWLRGLTDKAGERTGRKRIKDVEAQGFRVRDPDFEELTLWADPRTKVPVLIEGMVRLGNRRLRIVLSDFEIDPPLDEALFVLTPPAGYTLRKVTAVAPSLEGAVAHLLRAYAHASRGTFPVRLDDWSADEAAFARMDLKALPEQDALKLAQSFARVVKFAHEAPTAYGYRTVGARLGDGDTMIFWYRPAGAATFRVVYGDLRIGDVTADKLPEQPKP